MIFNVNLTVKHLQLIVNDLHIFFQCENKIGLIKNDRMLKMTTSNFPKSVSHENEFLSLSWYIEEHLLDLTD